MWLYLRYYDKTTYVIASYNCVCDILIMLLMFLVMLDVFTYELYYVLMINRPFIASLLR